MQIQTLPTKLILKTVKRQIMNQKKIDTEKRTMMINLFYMKITC